MMGSPTASWPYNSKPTKEELETEQYGLMARAYKTIREETKPGKTPDRRASKMRLFHLLRLEDASGVSGTGVVAEGVEFSDGTICLKWTTKLNCTGIYRSVHELLAIHGHGGKTNVVWLE